MNALSGDFGFTYDQLNALTSQAFDLVDAGQLESAAAMFAGIVALCPRDAMLLTAYGSVLHLMGCHEDALTRYDEALAIDGALMRARVNRGDIRCSRGDLGGLDDLRLAANTPSRVQARARHLLARYSR